MAAAGERLREINEDSTASTLHAGLLDRWLDGFDLVAVSRSHLDVTGIASLSRSPFHPYPAVLPFYD